MTDDTHSQEASGVKPQRKRLGVKREPIADFVNALFRYAEDKTFVSLRSFVKNGAGDKLLEEKSVKLSGADLDGVIDAALECPGNCIHVERATDGVEVAGPHAQRVPAQQPSAQ